MVKTNIYNVNLITIMLLLKHESLKLNNNFNWTSILLHLKHEYFNYK